MINQVIVHFDVKVLHWIQPFVNILAAKWQFEIFCLLPNRYHELCNVDQHAVLSVELWRHSKELVVVDPETKLVFVNLCVEVVELLQEL